MKPFKNALRIQCMFILLLMFPQVLQDQVRADNAEKRILILPFQIHAAKDIAYMENAISDMLSSRLEKVGKVSVIKENTRANEISEVSILGERHNADYVITGSMTFFGEEVSTDARVYETGKTLPVIVFHEYGNTSDGVLVHIEKFAEHIDRQVLGVGDPGSVMPFQEKTDKPASSTGSAYTWHSQKLEFPVVGLCAGDLDGDGQLEWVLAGESDVYIYSMQADVLRIETTLPQVNSTVLGVDAVDVNGNERAELFITRKRRESRVDAVVLEWNGTAYDELQTGLKWYFRTSTDQQNRLILLGQKQGHINSYRLEDANRYLFESGIYRFQSENGTYTPGPVLSLPEDANIYWVGTGDVMGTGSVQTMLLGRKDILSLISGNETVEWSSAEAYGGSNIYVETQMAGDKINSNETERQYLSQRIHVTDINGDGRKDVIVPRNKDTGRNMFEKFRNYKSGSVVVLSWQDTNLEIVWETSELSGYISDTWLVDVTNDGRPELAYCLVTSSGVFSGQQTSRLFIQEISGESINVSK